MRYLDWARFLSLLEQRSIYCPAASLLQDKFEGSLSAADVIEGRSQTTALMYHKVFRRCTYISCWCLSEYESVGMWHPYGSMVAIHTSFDKLKNLFIQHGFDVGLVGYFDFDKDRIHMGIPPLQFFFKRREFEFEHEVRAVSKLPHNLPDFEGNWEEDWHPSPGISISVNLQWFIDRVTVAPDTPVWVVDLIKCICDTYKLRKPVVRSSLDVEPRY